MNVIITTIQSYIDIALKPAGVPDAWSFLLAGFLMYNFSALVVTHALAYFVFIGSPRTWDPPGDPAAPATDGATVAPHVRKQMEEEIWLSILAIPKMSVVGSLYRLGVHAGYSKVYTDVEEYGLTYFLLSIPTFFVAIDFLIYWIHYFMHTPLLYKYVHKHHHYSRTPTPFTGHSFHWIEGAALMTPYLTIGYIMPIHQGVELFFLVLTMVWAIIQHSLNFGWRSGVVNTATHHAIHHRENVCNYAEYLSLWDRLNGTYKDPYTAGEK